MNDSTPRTFPSIWAKVGDWDYYVTTMTYADVAIYVRRPKQTSEKEDFKNWLQRELDDTRLRTISQYLVDQNQRFFNAIVVGIFAGDPEWYPVSISKGPTLGDVEIDERAKTSIGILRLIGSEEAFAIDGQHRVEAIKHAIKINSRLKTEEQCVIFVAHKTDKLGHERTRRLFTTLNKYARPVSTGEIVALDEDDAFAIVTRRLMEEYKPLRGGFVTFTKRQNLPVNDKKGITTTVALYQLIQALALPKGSKERAQLKIGPPKSEKINAINKGHRAFWNALIRHVPELKRVSNSKPDEELAGEYRTANGGHVLFRPAGQQAFTNAVRTMMDRGIKLNTAVRDLASTVLRLNADPWPGVLWDPLAKTMITKKAKLSENLFLYMVGQPTSHPSYDLNEEFRKATGADLRPAKQYLTTYTEETSEKDA